MSGVSLTSRGTSHKYVELRWCKNILTYITCVNFAPFMR